MIKNGGIVIVDVSLIDYVTSSTLARDGLLFEYTHVYNELGHVIYIFDVIYTKCGLKCLSFRCVHH